MSKMKNETVRLLVTPEQAKLWLAKNEGNRPIQKAWVEALCATMRRGEWHPDVARILIATDGTLLDGQHRLSAIVQYGAPVELDVCFGADSRSVHYCDTNKARTPAERLRRLDVPHHVKVSAYARAAYAILFGHSVERFSGPNVALWLYQGIAHEAINWAVKGLPRGERLGCAPIGGALVLAHCAYPEKTENFVKCLVSNSLNEGTPQHAFARMLLNASAKSTTAGSRSVSLKTLRAVRAYVQGSKLQVLLEETDFDFFGLRDSKWEELKGL